MVKLHVWPFSSQLYKNDESQLQTTLQLYPIERENLYAQTLIIIKPMIIIMGKEFNALDLLQV